MRGLVSLLLSLGILAAGVLAFRGFGMPAEVPRNENSGDGKDAGVPVRTTEIRTWELPFQISLNGEAVTWRIITVGAEVSGKVTHRNPTARGGQFVSEGDVLFEVDSLNYQLEKERLTAELNREKSEIESIAVDIANAESLLKLAEEESRLQQTNLQRVISLQKDRAAGTAEVDNATRLELASRNALQTIRNQLTALQQDRITKDASVRLVEVQLRRAEADLERCRIRSPLTGRVVEDLVEEGDYIRSGDPLIRISDSSKMEVRCSLRGEEAAWIWRQHGLVSTQGGDPDDPLKMPQVPCEVVFEFDGVETIWDGYLSRFEGTGLDRQTRMFPCRVVVEKPETSRVTSSEGGSPAIAPPTLLSGMFVKVQVPIQSPMPLLQVPVEAVRPGSRLWIVRDRKLLVAEVSVVKADEQIALIRPLGDDIKAGDRVIISPLAVISEGMAVQETNP